ncbi:MAG: hypothetical protein WDN24_14185 [Sphingomonas sp.]
MGNLRLLVGIAAAASLAAVPAQGQSTAQPGTATRSAQALPKMAPVSGKLRTSAKLDKRSDAFRMVPATWLVLGAGITIITSYKLIFDDDSDG